jgi:hypothetical protein
MAAEREHLSVAGDQEISLGGDERPDDLIVVDIGSDHRRNRKRRHQLDGLSGSSLSWPILP